MNIKKFVAETAQEALQMVKREMGPEAVILKTRTLRVKGGKKKIEVTAAIDYESSNLNDSPSETLRMEEFLERWKALEAQIREIKTAIVCGQAERHLPPEIYFNNMLRHRFMNYKSFGLNWQVIQELMNGGENRRLGADMSTSHILKDSLANVLSKIQTGTGRREGRGARIFSFIGPTGVGKTTTLAKLAALGAVKQGKKTALITLDTFRIAAVDQLQSYARIMGIPLEVAVSRPELQEAVHKHRDCDLIFIDTVGRSPNHGQAIEELRDILDIPEYIHGYLVLSATEQYGNLLHTDRSFAALPFKSYIFTKLDETQDTSPMINFLITRGKPVSYFTAGQQVPEDIEVATKRKLASLILASMRDSTGNYSYEVSRHGSSNWT
ncbi:MAG: hypothetical protein JRJ01_01080 [Deltaproteobacteria bacterium]|nr:hypothetical protein [Deltaproteobacteria bacterium]